MMASEVAQPDALHSTLSNDAPITNGYVHVLFLCCRRRKQVTRSERHGGGTTRYIRQRATLRKTPRKRASRRVANGLVDVAQLHSTNPPLDKAQGDVDSSGHPRLLDVVGASAPARCTCFCASRVVVRCTVETCANKSAAITMWTWP